MLSTALALALLTTAGLCLVYAKLPRKVRRLLEKYNLLTDILCLVGIYLLLGGTLTALTAAAMCGVMISIMLYVAKNEQDYLFLYDFRNLIKEKLKVAKEALEAYGQAYRERNEEKKDDVQPVAT